MSAQLDSYDLKLLMAVQQDARTPQNELGEAVSLSTAAVNRRLKRLGEEGVIERYTAVVSPDAVGYGLTIIAMVEVESEQIDQLDATRRSFTACPQVQQCYYVAGEWDFVLLFVVQHMEQYNGLTRQLFFGNANVKRFKTLVAMSRDKVGLALPLELGAG
ncbi:Lrp/AsnC family transcriptional regulator [Vogesella facilis]|uniref:Lrp/AsnC family transcriptional regulator n=1 Tax=Vogesella facilis TaxID=1655232 RepID=A0ABV7RBB7_9NEIS